VKNNLTIAISIYTGPLIVSFRISTVTGLNDGEDVRIHHISIIEEKVSKIVDNPAYENSQ
jgi:hypothetical protein